MPVSVAHWNLVHNVPIIALVAGVQSARACLSASIASQTPLQDPGWLCSCVHRHVRGRAPVPVALRSLACNVSVLALVAALPCVHACITGLIASQTPLQQPGWLSLRVNRHVRACAPVPVADWNLVRNVPIVALVAEVQSARACISGSIASQTPLQGPEVLCRHLDRHVRACTPVPVACRNLARNVPIIALVAAVPRVSACTGGAGASQTCS